MFKKGELVDIKWENTSNIYGISKSHIYAMMERNPHKITSVVLKVEGSFLGVNTIYRLEGSRYHWPDYMIQNSVPDWEV